LGGLLKINGCQNMKSYQIYLVGGAVRDALLGLPVHERDWIVVGATPQQLLAQGFKPVGKDFPVFLHPKSQEEYALARTERKVGKGYHGFECYAAQEVTLEQDLARRDLTINAIAQDENGELIDPYHGVSDLQQRLLRHVSAAFTEDPLRVLRAARFAARFAHLGFQIAPETMALMQNMSSTNELLALHPNRIWNEWQKALTTTSPWIFADVLQACGAWMILFPSLKRLAEPMYQQLAKVRLQRLIAQQASPQEYFAAWLADLEKSELDQFFKSYTIPHAYAELAHFVVKHKATAMQWETLTAPEWVTFLGQADVLRKNQRWQQFITVASTLMHERQGSASTQKMQENLLAAAQLFATVKLSTDAMSVSGKEIKVLLENKRMDIFLKEPWKI